MTDGQVAWRTQWANYLLVAWDWRPTTDGFLSNNISAISCFNDRICGRWKVWESSPGKTLLSPSSAASRTCKRSTTRWTVNNSLSRCFKRPKDQMRESRVERHLWRWMNDYLKESPPFYCRLPPPRKMWTITPHGNLRSPWNKQDIPLCPRYTAYRIHVHRLYGKITYTGNYLSWSKHGSVFIRLIEFMVYHIYGLFWLDKTVDHISDMQCTLVIPGGTAEIQLNVPTMFWNTGLCRKKGLFC